MACMALFGAKTTIDLEVVGMTDDNSVEHVRKALLGVTGVKGADVDLDAGKAEVTVNMGTNQHALMAAIKSAGFEARPA